jgi:putative membrane protein
MSDPRIFFAAERTLLAWVRTGLTMMAFGFVVAKFGLVIEFLSTSKQLGGEVPHFDWIANVLGITFVLLGVGVIGGAWVNHREYVQSLPGQDLPQLILPWLTSLLAVSLAVVGCLLAIYLALV